MVFLDKVQFVLIGFTRPILSMLAVYVAYLVLGSLIFVHLETAEEDKERARSFQVVEKAKEMVNLIRTSNFSDSEIYYSFMREHEEQKAQPMHETLKWGQMFGDKVFFAFILITTVGYGNVSFKSKLGQAFCVIYTMFGLPIHVVMMRLLSFKFRGGLREIFSASQVFLPRFTWNLAIAGFIFFLGWTAIFIFIPAHIFTLSEDWPYNTGIYFSFVSLTTIGLGDYVAGVSSEHIDSKAYPFALCLMLIWMFFGLGFVSMALNMLSYVMGIFTLDKLDSKCRERAEAKRKLGPLFGLITELNWQLVKCKPDTFKSWEEIEEFKTFMTENPQDVTPEMLKRVFDIVTNLKETSYDQLSAMQLTTIPMTPVIQRAKDNLPYILSKQSTNVSFSAEDQVRASVDHRQSSIKALAEQGETSTSLTDLIEEKKTSVKKKQSDDTLPSVSANEDSKDSLKSKSEPITSNLAEDDVDIGLAEAKSESAIEKPDDDDGGTVDK